eukprot:2008413-Amphidinium_carterae.1
MVLVYPLLFATAIRVQTAPMPHALPGRAEQPGTHCEFPRASKEEPFYGANTLRHLSTLPCFHTKCFLSWIRDSVAWSRLSSASSCSMVSTDLKSWQGLNQN